jgi:hypothetical protein
VDVVGVVRVVRVVDAHEAWTSVAATSARMPTPDNERGRAPILEPARTNQVGLIATIGIGLAVCR